MVDYRQFWTSKFVEETWVLLRIHAIRINKEISDLIAINWICTFKFSCLLLLMNVIYRSLKIWMDWQTWIVYFWVRIELQNCRTWIPSSIWRSLVCRLVWYTEVLPTACPPPVDVGILTSSSVFLYGIHLYCTIVTVVTLRLNWYLLKYLLSVKTSTYSTINEDQTYTRTNYPLLWQ